MLFGACSKKLLPQAPCSSWTSMRFWILLVRLWTPIFLSTPLQLSYSYTWHVFFWILYWLIKCGLVSLDMCLLSMCCFLFVLNKFEGFVQPSSASTACQSKVATSWDGARYEPTGVSHLEVSRSQMGSGFFFSRSNARVPDLALGVSGLSLAELATTSLRSSIIFEVIQLRVLIHLPALGNNDFVRKLSGNVWPQFQWLIEYSCYYLVKQDSEMLL